MVFRKMEAAIGAANTPSEEERELVIDETHSNEQDFERLMKMDEEWPDHFEERSHGSRGVIEEAGERAVVRPAVMNRSLAALLISWSAATI